MAKCEYCKKEMLTAKGCIYKKYITASGKVVKRALVNENNVDSNNRCVDCGAMLGNYHHFGCDNELCLKCHGQIIGNCECNFVSMEV